MCYVTAAHAEYRLAPWVKDNARGHKAVLDLGCGRGAYLSILHARTRCGIDSFLPYIEDASNRLSIYGMRFIHGDIRNYRELVDCEYDCAILIDSLEHLTKDDGMELIRKLKEDVKKIIIFTPDGWHDQGDVDGNEAQRHLSGWKAWEFEELGFEASTDLFFHYTNPPEKRGAVYAIWTSSDAECVAESHGAA